MTNTTSTNEQIRHRAFQLWEEHGRPDGHEEAFWLQAERELKSESNNASTDRNDDALRSGTGSDGRR